MEEDTPPVPHTNPELLRQALIFNKRLIAMLEHASSSSLVNKELASQLHLIINKHSEYCNSMIVADGAFEILINPASIAKRYGLPNLWKDVEAIISGEVNNWGKFTQHPSIPSTLARKVDTKTTKKLIQLMHSDLFRMSKTLDIEIAIKDDVRLHHLFWLPTASGVYYATPSSYDIATQFSFDIPHNVAHLNHLLALERKGALRYDDDMPQRAYFEAVAVLSEFTIVDALRRDSDIGRKILEVLGINSEIMSVEKFNAWMVQDRSFEFKLRAARLYADYLVIQGYSFKEVAIRVSKKIGISIEHATNEIRKYLPWTGLGAVYTYGYRQLLISGIDNVKSAIYAQDGSTIQSWQQFRKVLEPTKHMAGLS
jgi:hypothetical protein